MSTKHVLLECGCISSSLITHLGGEELKPWVPTCYHGTTKVIKEMPNLTGREARCSYGDRVVNSDWALAFFEYHGPDSQQAEDMCGCGYARKAHTPEVQERNPKAGCKTFRPHGAHEFDRFYCGCRGWS